MRYFVMYHSHDQWHRIHKALAEQYLRIQNKKDIDLCLAGGVKLAGVTREKHFCAVKGVADVNSSE
jgi:hypothetical protein